MRLALFGGTFDPIHSAHLTVAGAAAETFSLDRVLFVPAANPPHKPESLGPTYEERFRMVDLACEAIRDSKLKVQTQIQDRQIRVTSKDRDVLQEVIAFLRGKDFPVALAYNNFRP